MDVRKGQINVTLDEVEFKRRMLEKFFDPHFESVGDALDKVIEAAWENYSQSRKSPLTQKAGPEFADPDYHLSVEWRETRDSLIAIDKVQRNPATPSKILVVCASPRNDQTCPGEMSKTFRLAKIAQELVEKENFECDFLDLSRLTAEYGKVIYPCKACVSTAMPLCHWPCSCYPNHSLQQNGDWMAEIYEKWTAAHGIMIVTPVHWYQSPSVLKLMIDRLVCADGGNPDPTTTSGKDPVKAKALEMKGWDYPKHLAGRAFGVVVHGDAAGVENLTRILSDWLTDMDLIPSGSLSQIGRYVGYLKPYATSHEDLDKDQAVQLEAANVALSLIEQVRLIRSNRYTSASENLTDPRQK